MQRFIFILAIFLIISCNNNDPVQPLKEKTHFNGSVNNENWKSDGIAYLREESMIHVRGFLGTVGSHYQIDIVLKNNNAGTYLLDSSVVSASVSDVVGMDAIGATYVPQESSYIMVEYDNNLEFVSGNLKYHGYSQSYNDTIEIISEFKLRIGSIETAWTCDFTKDGISNCRFIE